MLGNFGLCTIDKEVIDAGFLGFVDGMAKIVGVEDGVLGHGFRPEP